MNPLFKPPTVKMGITTEDRTPLKLQYVVGVDLGNLNDRTAITVLEVSVAQEITYARAPREPERQETGRRDVMHYLVRLLHRPRIGTGYPAIVQQVAAIIEDLPAMPEKPHLVVDATGLGAPVVQRMRELKIAPRITGLTITAGNTASVTGRDWTAPKALLVGQLRLALHRGLLKVAQGFSARETLATELAAFQARLSPSGRATFEAEGNEHDDTVLSLALAIFAANNRPRPPRFENVDWMAGGMPGWGQI